MIRGLRHEAAAWCTRFISIGGRRTRGGFGHPLGKHPQVKQGVVEGVPRRIPGTTKVTYTNKKGRSFTFSIPVAEITHPQVNLTNASGSWKEMDTSFSDIGDMEDDMPSPVDDCLRAEPGTHSLLDLHESFVSFCKEYVLMNTSGMKNTVVYGELNVGPDYEHYDRRLKRKRHWLAIRHRFEDVRELLWPEETHETENSCGGSPLSVAQMLDALLWLEAASTFCVRKVHPADIAEKDEFLSLNLHREVMVVARRVKGDATFFSDSPNSLDRFSACVALCANHGVPYSLLFETQHTPENTDASDRSCILENVPSVHTVFDAIRVMSIIEGNNNKSYMFSDAAGKVVRRNVMHGLSRLINTRAFGGKDTLENVGENELCVLLRFCAEVREQNPVFFLLDVTDKEEESSLVARYRQVSHIALARCRHLLYHLDGPRTQAMSEGGYIPFVDMQQHAERTNKDTLVHYNLGIRSAQGFRRVRLGAQSSAYLAELVDRLEGANTRVSGCTLLLDLVQHLSQKAASSQVSLTLREVNLVLPLLARMRRETPTGVLDSRFDRLFAAMDTTIGAAMQQERSVEELVSLVEGLAACDFLPSSFKQVEMVLLRITIAQSCGLTQMTQILRALSFLLKSDVSPVLLQATASHATTCVMSVRKHHNRSEGDSHSNSIDNTVAVQLIEFLEALESCRYAALPGFIAFCWEAYIPKNVELSLRGRCTYASLLATAVSAMQEKIESVSEQLASDSRRYFVEYAQSTQEEDLGRFVSCVTGLASVGFSNVVESTDTRLALVAFLRSSCLTQEKCATLPSVVLANLLESMFKWCVVLGLLPLDSCAKPIETTLLSRFLSLKGPRNTSESLEELDEAAYRVVCLQHASEDLRKEAAEILGRAIIRAEAAADAWRPAPQQGRSFEVEALSISERGNNHMNVVLRYCTALHQSGMARHVEELVF